MHLGTLFSAPSEAMSLCRKEFKIYEVRKSTKWVYLNIFTAGTSISKTETLNFQVFVVVQSVLTQKHGLFDHTLFFLEAIFHFNQLWQRCQRSKFVISSSTNTKLKNGGPCIWEKVYYQIKYTKCYGEFQREYLKQKRLNFWGATTFFSCFLTHNLLPSSIMLYFDFGSFQLPRYNLSSISPISCKLFLSLPHTSFFPSVLDMEIELSQHLHWHPCSFG